MEDNITVIRTFSFGSADLKEITEIRENAVAIQKDEEGEIIEENIMDKYRERNDDENYELEDDEDSIEVSEEDLSKLEILEREFQKIIYQHYSYNDLVREYNMLENEIYRDKKRTANKEYELKVLESLIMIKGEKIEKGEINE